MNGVLLGNGINNTETMTNLKDQVVTTRNDRKVPTLGLDLDGVIDENANFFGVLSCVWPGDVYVITSWDDRSHCLVGVVEHGFSYSLPGGQSTATNSRTSTRTRYDEVNFNW